MKKLNLIGNDKFILLIVVIFLVFTFGIYAPFEMYLMNVNEFWFGLSAFVLLSIGVSVILGGILFFPSLFLKNKKLDNYIAIIIGCGLAMYIQGNFLNLSVGVLNGASIDWAQYQSKFLYNLLVWIGFIVLPVVVINIKPEVVKKLFAYVAALLTMMQLVSLVIILLTVDTQKQDTANGERKYISSKNLFNLSEDENVVVFLCDMFDDRYFKALLESHTELETDLKGFTQFINSTGSYSTTQYSIGSLMTGKYIYNDTPFAESLNAAYTDSKMFEKLDKNGYRIDCYMYWGCSPSDMWAKGNISNFIEEEGKEKVNNYPAFTKYLYQMVMCKYMPDILKPYIWMNGTEFNDLKEIESEYPSYNVDNMAFYTALKQDGIVTQNEEKTFKFMHIKGAHYPWKLNQYVEEVDESETSELENAWGAFQIVLEYINEMKKNNVYDNSAIIIMADHGYYWEGVLTNPVLLVKPKGGEGKLAVSAAPVSHYDFQPSVLYLAGLNDDQEFGKSYFDIGENEERERLFYQINLNERSIDFNYRLIEYSIDSKANKRENFHLTDVEYLPTGEKIPHKENCEFCCSGETEPIETDENWPVKVIHNSLIYK